MILRRSLRHGLLGVCLLAVFPGAGSAAAAPFEQWLQALRDDAEKRGISQSTIKAALTNIRPIERVLELDRKQPEFTLTFKQYMDRVVTPDRVERGRRLARDHKALLDGVGKQYGVQPRFIVALWGIETDFGRLTGGFPVIEALATLAYDGRRSDYFRQELMHALSIVDAGHIPVEQMRGSWAGAMGQCQFMPSSFVRFARDHDDDGKSDIWNNRADVFASAANYLSSSGWRGDQAWGREVSLSADFDRSLLSAKVVRSLTEWQAIGVRRADGAALPSHAEIRAALIEAEAGGPVFLVYDNFRTILKWNRSIFFGLAVGHLADRIGNP